MDEVLRDLENVHRHCVSILEAIDKLCRDNGIKYSLTGGSVIGAHLYQGIIPWDDDIDIMMTRDQYERFLLLAESSLPPRYVVKNFENGRDRTILFSKVIDENTTVVERKSGGGTVAGGVFVDVTVMDRVPRSIGRRKLCHMYAKLLQCCKERNYEKTESLSALGRNAAIFALKPFADRIYHAAKRYITGNSDEPYDYSEIFAGFTIPYGKGLFDRYVDIRFEGKNFMIVEDYMSYLETRYGRREFYREKQADDAPCHLVYVDCDHPYSEYLKNQRIEDSYGIR